VATTLETLVVKLAGDSADYDKTFKDAGTSLDSFAKNAKDIGGKLSLAVTTPLLALGGVALNSASDLEETTSKVNTLFGDQATAIQTWANNSSAAFGLSKEAALDSVGTLGNMFMQLGAQNAHAATLSQGMVELSADIASFHNVAGGSGEVLDAMTSAFRGEYDALQRYIPTINAAAVEHTALAMTGKESAKELTSLEKALAVQEIIMRDAGAAVGDFARTSDGLANTQRILQADLADISAELGKELIPVALEVTRGVKDLLGWFKELSPESKKIVVGVAGIAAAAGPVIIAVGTMASAVSGIMGLIGGTAGLTTLLGGLGTALTVLTGPIGIVLLAVAGLAAAWATDFLGIRTKTEEFWGWISTETPKQLGSLKTSWEGFTDWLQSDNTTKLETLKSGWGVWYEWLDTQTGGKLTTVKGYWDNFIGGAQTTVLGGLQIMQGDWSGGLETLRGVAEGAWNTIYSLFGTQIEAVKGVITGVDWWALGEAIMQGVANGIDAGLSWVTEAARGAAQAALDAAKGFLGIRSPSRLASNEIGKPFSEGVGAGMAEEMPNVTNRLQAALDGLMRDIVPAQPQMATAASAPINVTVYLSGSATYDDGRALGTGIVDEFRARGIA